MKGKKILAAVLCTAVMLLGGCSMIDQAMWNPEGDDAIRIASDGSVTEMVRDTLDQAYYSADELEKTITSSVEEYNQSHGEDSVKVASFKTEDADVTLKMEYASLDDYAAFNNLELYQGSMINAQLDGYLFDGSFFKIKNGEVSGKAVDSSAVFSDGMSSQVLIVQGPLEVCVDGKVTYISSNAQILSSDTVNASGKQEETSDGESYAEWKEANRVYIIYE